MIILYQRGCLRGRHDTFVYYEVSYIKMGFAGSLKWLYIRLYMPAVAYAYLGAGTSTPPVVRRSVSGS